jgi:hypothetical protein
MCELDRPLGYVVPRKTNTASADEGHRELHFHFASTVFLLTRPSQQLDLMYFK